MSVFVRDPDVTLYHGDALEVLLTLAGGSADACVTSPPYLDARPEYPSPTILEHELIFAELRRVVTGPLLLNVGRVWRERRELRWWVEMLDACERSGWQHVDTLVWVKPNANPIKGDVLADSHEYVFLLGDPDSFNTDGVRRPHAEETVSRFARPWKEHRGVKAMSSKNRVTGRPALNPLGARPRSYFEAYVGKEKGNPHPAPMALDLAAHLVKLACCEGGLIIDPFAGSGNTAIAARAHGRRSILIELVAAYCADAAFRLGQQTLLTGDAA